MPKIILPFVVLGLLLSQSLTSIAAWEIEQGSRGIEGRKAEGEQEERVAQYAGIGPLIGLDITEPSLL